MAYIPSSGSVVAFQGTSPWVGSTGNASVITVNQGSVATVIIGGSILTSSTANQSVSGSVGIVGNPSISGTVLVNNGSVVAFQGGAWSASIITGNSSIISVGQGSIATVIIGGSILTSSTANQSVSGTVGASIIGQLPGGTAPLGSVATLQGTNPWIIVGSVYGSGSIAGTYANSNVASTVTGLAVMFKQNISTSIMTEISPTFPLPITGAVAASISGNVTINSPSVYGNISGSVVATQGTSPWVVNYQNSSIITVSSASIAAVIIGGSIATATTNSSVMLLNGANVIGSVTALQGTNPWIGTISNSSIIAINAGSVVTLSQGSVITLLQSSSIIAVPTGNQSVSGTVNLGGTVVSSTIGGASVFQYGIWRVSVAGTYATAAASVVSGLGVLTLGLRNDSLASIYGANGAYSPHTIGAAGEQVVAVAPFTAQVTGVASCFTGVEQPIITSVTGNYIYVTGVQITNNSANAVYMSFYGAGLGSVTGSIIGFTVAPANGGSNIVYTVPLKTGVSSPFSASISGAASIYVSAQGFYSNT